MTTPRMEGDLSRRRRISWPVVLAAAALTMAGSAVRAAAAPAPVLYFEHNEGQVDARAAFIARTAGPAAFLTGTGPWMNARTADGRTMGVGIRFTGGDPAACLQPGDALPGKVNYLRGSDPASWRTNIPTCATVRHESVWPGIDVEYLGYLDKLEYRLIVHPDRWDSRELQTQADRFARSKSQPAANPPQP